MTEILINHKTKLKIDTGADVTVLPETEYKTSRNLLTLQKPDKVLYGAGMNHFSVQEQFTTTLKRTDHNCSSVLCWGL